MSSSKRMIVGIGAVIASTLMVIGCSTNSSGISSGNATTSADNSVTNSTSSTSSNLVSNTNSTSGDSGIGNQASGSSNSVSTGTTENTTQSSTTVRTQSTSSFPTIVNMAMNYFSVKVLTGAEAPTEVPQAASGSNQLFYKIAQSTTPIMGYPGFESSYTVTLSSPYHQIANFSGVRYESSTHASDALTSSLGSSPNTGSQSTVYVGGGNHKADLTTDATSSSSTIRWSEGRWTIQVTTTSTPSSLANQIANYLDAHFIPVPQNKGFIFASDHGSTETVMVTWQENNEIYGVLTNNHTKQPVDTALGMAISMRKYQ